MASLNLGDIAMGRLLLAAQLLLLFQLSSQQDVSISPSELVANEGENATFVCAPFIEQARPVLQTIDPGSNNIEIVELQDNDKVTFVNNGDNRTYIWIRVNRTDDHLRQFRCEINEMLTPFINLTVNFAPEYEAIDPVNAVEGDQGLVVTIPFGSRPDPDYQWTHNGEPIQNSPTRTLSASSVTLSTVSREDRGTYVVTATNSAGSGSGSFSLLITFAPSISAQFSDSVVDCLDFPLVQQDGPPVELLVNLTADPCPSVQWYINDTLITNETSDTQIIDPCDQYVLGDTEFSYQLIISALTAATTGFYRATFSNAGGETSVDKTFVTPFLRGRIISLQGVPYHPIDDSTGCLLAGSNVEIVCKHLSYPPATVEFIKDGSTVDPLSTNRVNQTCDTLEIFGVEASDAGSYVCRVDNDDDPQPSDTSLAISLVYCTAPAITGDLTFSKNNPEEGEQTIATCMWSGDPAPTVQWLKDGEVLVEADLPDHLRITPISTEGTGSRLEILDVRLSDAGDYTCNISNPVGFDLQVKRLEVRDSTTEPTTDSTTALTAGVWITIGLVLCAMTQYY